MPRGGIPARLVPTDVRLCLQASPRGRKQGQREVHYSTVQHACGSIPCLHPFRPRHDRHTLSIIYICAVLHSHTRSHLLQPGLISAATPPGLLLTSLDPSHYWITSGQYSVGGDWHLWLEVQEKTAGREGVFIAGLEWHKQAVFNSRAERRRNTQQCWGVHCHKGTLAGSAKLAHAAR